MVEGGATSTSHSENFVQGVFELIQESESVKKAARDFLEGQDDSLKDLTNQERVIELLNGDKSNEFLEAISKSLSEEEKFKKLAEQIGKDSVMREKLEALGNQLLTQGVIGGAAFTTLTGALAGLAIGGVAGALIVGGAALAGFVALVAVAAIAYAIYEHRGEIKEGVIKLGQAIKSFLKNLIDKLPTFQERENNFKKLKNNFMEQHYKNANEEEKTTLGNKIKIVETLQDKDQRSAIEELVKNKNIKDFSKEDMDRLVEKGLSTFEKDMEPLKELMDEFLSAITNDSKIIEQVKEIVDKKVEEMKPSLKIDDPNPEQAGPGQQTTPS